MRVENHPILTFEKGERVTFTFDGKVCEGYAGEPIAAALHACGVRALGHSHQDGRPRGFYCAIGNCSSCKMVVNGKANVRVCVEPLMEGLSVETQQGKGEIR
ncbi:MAG: (2Fe-2S)-binding protein [Clostridia bacterium]|nr:(2Fe-2S)-binding protein [Clostridia bacterium]